MVLTVTDIQLEKILRKAYLLGEQNGEEKTLIHQGKLPEYVRKTEAETRIGKPTYQRAVDAGYLNERKLDPTKKNSPIVVSRKDLNYVEKIMSNPNF
ncbi:MAG: hypothetical protein CVU09_00420 [Bacteroidetes bacterium HGW-Bacteroidetes-4]|jgi:hypothetical protein|nr:MAG: hypothetical protein CVU09_00420 [Bacteroidetes bacterium HGW-Bacteroidetes-4]